MSIYSVNKGAKSSALQYEALATDVQGQQRDVDFARTLLSNIRQERIARAQIRAAGYSDNVVSSGSAGALANVDSSLAGEMGYSYESSERAEKMQTYVSKAQEQWKRYAKSVKRAQTAGAVTGAVLAAAGGLFVGPAAAAGLAAAGVGAGTAGTLGTMIGAAAGGATGIGVTSVGGGGHIATGAATRAAISGTITAGLSAAATAAPTGTSEIVQISDTGAREVTKIATAPGMLDYLRAYGGTYFKTLQSAYSSGNNLKGMW